MTAVQVAKLAYPTNQTIVVSGKTYPKTYQAANNMLRRMAANKVIKCQSFPTSIADWFMLPLTQKIKDPRKYQHEQGAADLFVAYYAAAQTQGGQWAYEPAILKERADRGLRLFGKTFYFEVDRATESPREIEAKLENYIRYGRISGERFHVIFTVLDSPKQPAQKRGEALAPLLEAGAYANQFLIASYARLTAAPFGKLLFSPQNELYSLKDVV